ncbi:MAG: ribonuclease III [Opitutaceae bacterium]|nr:ribonuclease III [Opitutaceae bacterium]
MPDSHDHLALLQARLGYTFRQPALLLEALTHPSYLQDHPEAGAHNQRLEFLGDAVLHFTLTDALFRHFPNEREGTLSRRRATLSKGEFLSRLARDLGLHNCLRLSRSEEDSGGRQRASIREDALEAVAGAIYLDSDLETARRVVLAWYGSLSAHLEQREDRENPKGRLQELVQPAHGNNALRYELVGTSGPLHAREYEVAVLLNDRQLGTGRGSSKKLAEEAAAQKALTTLHSEWG